MLAAMFRGESVMAILCVRISRKATPRCAIFKWVISSLLGLSVIGCGGSEQGPARAAVEGMVTLDGQKLAAGVVRFIPTATGKNVGPAVMATVKEGAFQLSRSEGPVVGKHHVEIESTGHYGFDIDNEAAYAKAFQEKKGQALPPNPVPEIYNSKSTLTAVVKADEMNTFDFSLQSAGRSKK